MGVGYVYGGLVVTNETAQLDVLTDGQNLLLQCSLNGQVAHLASLERVHVSRILLHDNVSQIRYKLLEVCILCNEVGLGVNFDHAGYAALSANLCTNHALCSDTASLLCSLGQTLLAQQLNSLVEIAVCFLECLLAVHHAYAGHFAQLLYVSSSKSHFIFLQTKL